MVGMTFGFILRHEESIEIMGILIQTEYTLYCTYLLLKKIITDVHLHILLKTYSNINELTDEIFGKVTMIHENCADTNNKPICFLTLLSFHTANHQLYCFTYLLKKCTTKIVQTSSQTLKIIFCKQVVTKTQQDHH